MIGAAGFGERRRRRMWCWPNRCSRQRSIHRWLPDSKGSFLLKISQATKGMIRIGVFARKRDARRALGQVAADSEHRGSQDPTHPSVRHRWSTGSNDWVPSGACRDGLGGGWMLAVPLICLTAFAGLDVRGRYAMRRANAVPRHVGITHTSLWLVWALSIWIFVYAAKG
jgi:hypothetical protein